MGVIGKLCAEMIRKCPKGRVVENRMGIAFAPTPAKLSINANMGNIALGKLSDLVVMTVG